MKIHLHIQRLVLDGIPADQPRLLRQAFERELTSRLLEGGLSPEFRSGGAVPKVDGGAISLGHDCRPARLGTQIAGAVYRGIGAGK
jgi:hypothetical protein